MKNALTVSLLAFALSAVALVSVLTTSADPSDSTSTAVSESVGDSEAAVGARLESLSAEIRDLRERIARLELRPAEPPQRMPVLEGLASVAELDALRAEFQAALSGRQAPPSDVMPAEEPALAGAPEFKEQVASALSEIRKEEAVDKARSQLEKRMARLDETMPKIEEWLELAPSQTDAMRLALLAQYEREAELVRRWAAGEDTEVLSEVKASDRERHRDEVALFLTPEQLETYWNRVEGRGK